MRPDDVVREVRAAREAYGRQFGFDIAAMARDLRDRERRGGRRVVHLPPRRPKSPGGAVAQPA